MKIFENSSPNRLKVIADDKINQSYFLANNFGLQSSNNYDNLTRQNQTLKREITELKIENEKQKMQNFNKSAFININDENSIFDQIDLDNLDDEKKNILHEMIKEYENIKKETKEIKENAIRSLAEKELVNMELREKIEEMKTQHNNEMKQYLEKIKDYRMKLNDIEIDNSYYDEEVSFTKEEMKEIIEKFQRLEEEYLLIKQELEEKDNNFENDKMIMRNEFERTEFEYKTRIFNLEEEINYINGQITGIQIEKEQQLKDKEQESESNGLLIFEIEALQSKIRLMDENKIKVEANFKEQINILNLQIEELERQIQVVKLSKSEVEKELVESKLALNLRIKDEKEKLRNEMITKDKEIFRIKEKLSESQKDYITLKQTFEIQKNNYEKLKLEYGILNENIGKLKEIHDSEIKILEEKLNNTEKENSYIDGKRKSICLNFVERLSITKFDKKSNKTLLDALNSEDINNPPNPYHSQIVFLQNEVITMKDQLSEANLKIFKNQSIIGDYEYVLKDNKKLKIDLKNLNENSDKKINSLEESILNLNNEIEILTKKNLNLEKKENSTKFKNEFDQLKIENKNLKEKIVSLISEKNLMKENYDKKIIEFEGKFEKKDIEMAKIKIAYANIAFDKDCQKSRSKREIEKIKNPLNEDNGQIISNTIKKSYDYLKKFFP